MEPLKVVRSITIFLGARHGGEAVNGSSGVRVAGLRVQPVPGGAVSPAAVRISPGADDLSQPGTRFDGAQLIAHYFCKYYDPSKQVSIINGCRLTFSSVIIYQPCVLSAVMSLLISTISTTTRSFLVPPLDCKFHRIDRLGLQV